MYEEDVIDQDVVVDEDVEVELIPEVGNTEPEVTDEVIDCLLNITASAGTTVKIYEDDIAIKDFESVTSFPSANVLVVDVFEPEKTNDKCSEILEDEDASQYTIMFIKLSVYDELAAKSSYYVDYNQLLKKEDIDNEISNILSGD